MEGLSGQTQLLVRAATGRQVALGGRFSSSVTLGTHSSLVLGPHETQTQALRSSQSRGGDDTEAAGVEDTSLPQDFDLGP